MRHQELIIGDKMIIATTAPIRSPYAVHLMAVEGWDIPPEISRKTVKRLFGDGKIYSQNATFEEKPFSVELFAKFPDQTSIRGLRSNLMTVAGRINSSSTVQMVYYQNGVEVFRERIQAFPDTPFIEDWNPIANSVQVKLNFIAPSPWKEVFQNGAKTPEAKKRL